ncbi:MAG: HEAT repeat domain-containing protein [Oscillospiraceae bacterium]|nr:HEAT repeat domain-containing protein [Oscillospiraceae bacterium]MDY4192333.1 HEAT repeat domain-containing protein [Oscillospiraceae bacterium]
MFGGKLEKIQKYAEKKDLKKLLAHAEDKDPEVRAAVAKGLGEIRSDDSCNELITLLRDHDIAVQKEAVRAVGKIDMKAATEHVHHVMDHTSDEELIRLCHEALAVLSHAKD